MDTMIDWHAYQSSPVIVERSKEFTSIRPYIDAYTSTDLAKRVTEMYEVGIYLQLVCQGAGVYADQLAPEQALEIVRQSNDILAQRIAPHKERLLGVTALSLK